MIVPTVERRDNVPDLCWMATAGAAGLTTIAAALLGASGAKTKKAQEADDAYKAALILNDSAGAIGDYENYNQYKRGASTLRGLGVTSLLLGAGGGVLVRSASKGLLS